MMTPDQALATLMQAASMAAMPLRDHQTVGEAASVLKELITNSKPKAEDNKDESARGA